MNKVSFTDEEFEDIIRDIVTLGILLRVYESIIDDETVNVIMKAAHEIGTFHGQLK